MSPQASESAAPGRLRRRRGGILLVAALAGIVFWLVHPPILAGVIRFGLARAASAAGLHLEIGAIHANLLKPIVLERVGVRAKHPEQSRTAAESRRVEITLGAPWRLFFGSAPFVRVVSVDGLQGVFDFRPDDAAGPRRRLPLRWLPESFQVNGASVELRNGGQTCYLENAFADFSEKHTGRFRAAGLEIRAGGFQESFGMVQGITAWKNGAICLADVALRDGVRIENLEVQFARSSNPGLELQAAVFGGSLRLDIAFGSDRKVIDSAIWASNIDIAALGTFCGLKKAADGRLREARLTFRGVPGDALDGEASLRLVADGFRWNQRGWEALEIGASLIHRRLTVSRLELQQTGNVLSASGDLSLNEGWQGIARAPFLLNVVATVKNLGSLASLIGPPFDQMSGRMSLASSIRGQGGNLEGYLSAEGSSMRFRNLPIDSGRCDVTFAGADAQIARCEFWSGGDSMTSRGAVNLRPPHSYSGEIQMRLRNLAPYLAAFNEIKAPISGGSVQLRWQGDGNASAHSGAFDVALGGMRSAWTPAGLGGKFVGTYSPQNIYFSTVALENSNSRFSARATLAKSGVTLADGVLGEDGQRLAQADLFLPFDPFALAAGAGLAGAANDEKLYARIACDQPVDIEKLLRLTGNAGVVDGELKVDLTAGGTLAEPALDGELSARNLTLKTDDRVAPPAQVRLVVHAAERAGSLRLELQTSGREPAAIEYRGPLGRPSSQEPAGWLDGEVSVHASIPKLELAVLNPFLPAPMRLGGLLSGNFSLEGASGKLRLEGRLAIEGGSLEAGECPPLTGVRGAANFRGTRAVLDSLIGDLGGGPFELRAEAIFDDPHDPHYAFTLAAQDVRFQGIPNCPLTANASLLGSGGNSQGLVTGSLAVLEGGLVRRLEARLARKDGAEEQFVAPKWDRLIPPPLRNWGLDISIKPEAPLRAGPEPGAGEIVPDLRLSGNVGAPVPVGRISVRNARLFLPLTSLAIPEGFIDFIESSPWMPLLDIRGTAHVSDYEVSVYAFGPLAERRLILRSEPPLSQEALGFLLTTGMPPDLHSTFSRSLLLEGAQSSHDQAQPRTSLLDSIRGETADVPSLEESPRLPGGFELWRGLSLRPDVEGLSGKGLGYSVHFR